MLGVKAPLQSQGLVLLLHPSFILNGDLNGLEKDTPGLLLSPNRKHRPLHLPSTPYKMIASKGQPPPGSSAAINQLDPTSFLSSALLPPG